MHHCAACCRLLLLQINVLVRQTPTAGRVTVAARDIQAGELLAAVPLELCFEGNLNSEHVRVEHRTSQCSGVHWAC